MFLWKNCGVRRSVFIGIYESQMHETIDIENMKTIGSKSISILLDATLNIL